MKPTILDTLLISTISWFILTYNIATYPLHYEYTCWTEFEQLHQNHWDSYIWPWLASPGRDYGGVMLYCFVITAVNSVFHFGSSSMGIIRLSCLCGSIATVMTYFLAKHLMGRKYGYIAAGMLLYCPGFLWVCQSGNFPIPLHSCMALGAVLFFVKCLKES